MPKYTVGKIFFFGAGFSKAIDPKYPTMKELTNKIRKEWPVKTSCLQKKYKQISSVAGDDIEAILSYVSSTYPWEGEHEKALNKALFIEMTKAIHLHFTTLEAFPPKKDSNTKILGDFILKNKCLSITLNYDTLLESIIFASLSKKYQKANSYQALYWIPMQSIFERGSIGYNPNPNKEEYDPRGEKLPTILKLHGSANWLWTGRPNDETLYYSGKQRSLVYDPLTAGLIPYIIPPSSNKNTFYNSHSLSLLWEATLLFTRFFDELYIIGYSLPKTDLSINYLFKMIIQNSFSRNGEKGKHTIFIINTDNSKEFKERYIKVFGKERCNFDYCGPKALENFISSKLKT